LALRLSPELSRVQTQTRDVLPGRAEDVSAASTTEDDHRISAGIMKELIDRRVSDVVHRDARRPLA